MYIVFIHSQSELSVSPLLTPHPFGVFGAWIFAPSALDLRGPPNEMSVSATGTKRYSNNINRHESSCLVEKMNNIECETVRMWWMMQIVVKH